MLKDQLKCTIISGTGGNGSQSMNLKLAMGGDGGRGGNIYIEGDENIYDLASYDDGKPYRSGRGEHGRGKKKTGNSGADLVLKVPLTTEVHLRNRVPHIITKHGQKELLLEGGKGGVGSDTLIKYRNSMEDPDAYMDLNPGHGVREEVTLILKLRSDAIFLGYPNAGKSSLLNLLTNTNVKVAPYAFTTLEPQLGLMDGFILMDLPGLIEGAHEGKGLGTRFVKHTEVAGLVVHFVSLIEDDPLATYKSLRLEIEKIGATLAAKKELLVLSKTDEVTPEKVEEIKAKFSKEFPNLPMVAVSVIDDDSVVELKTKLLEMLREIKKTGYSQYDS